MIKQTNNYRENTLNCIKQNRISNLKHVILFFSLFVCFGNLFSQEYTIGDLIVYNGDFELNDFTGWETYTAPSVSLSVSANEALFSGANWNNSTLTRTSNHLPDGTYELTADFKFSTERGYMYFYARDESGQAFATTIVPDTTWQSTTISNVIVSNGYLKIGLNYTSGSSNAWIRVDNIRIKRIQRPNSQKYLPFLGVSHYSAPNVQMTGVGGSPIFPNFMTLAKDGGCNTIRTSYRVGGDNTLFYDISSEIDSLNLNQICGLFPTHDHPTYDSSLINVENECYNAIIDMNNRGITPEIIMIGNEINTNSNELTQYASWNYDDGTSYYQRVSETLQAAITGCRNAGYTGDIGIHIDREWVGFYSNIISYGLTDIQVAAFSCYPKLGSNNNTVEDKIGMMEAAATDLGLKVLVLETAAPYVSNDPWDTQDFDIENVAELSIAGQLHHVRKVCDLVLNIPNNMGIGVITWGSDIATTAIHPYANVTWNRAQITTSLEALPSIYAFGEYNIVNCTPTTITPWLQVNGGTWQNTNSVTINLGDSVKFGPHPVTQALWSWSGCGTSGSEREQIVSPTSSCSATVTYTNTCGIESTETFDITVERSVVVRARLLQGSSDNIQLLLDDAVVNTWTVNSYNYQDFTGTFEGTGNIKLYFPDNGTDVEIDYIQIDGTTFQAEAQAINTSVWQGQCGGSFSQIMNCEGYINFGELKSAQIINSIKTESKNIFTAFPNPAHNILNINGPETYDVNIYNNLGVNISNYYNLNNKSTIDISSLSNGLYFIKITGEKQYEVKRITIK